MFLMYYHVKLCIYYVGNKSFKHVYTQTKFAEINWNWTVSVLLRCVNSLVLDEKLKFFATVWSLFLWQEANLMIEINLGIKKNFAVFWSFSVKFLPYKPNLHNFFFFFFKIWRETFLHSRHLQKFLCKITKNPVVFWKL